MEEILQYTPDELEQQRMRAMQMRGQGMAGALMATSQVPGAAQQAQSLQRSADTQLIDQNRLNQRELESRRNQQDRRLKMALEKKKAQEVARANRAEEKQAAEDAERDANDVGRIYSTKRFVDSEGNEFRVGQAEDGRPYDVDNRRFLDPGEMSGKGMREEAPMSETKLNNIINSYVKEDKDFRQLEQDVLSAEKQWKKTGWDGEEPIFNWATKQNGFFGDALRLIADTGEEGAPSASNYAAAEKVMNTIARQGAGLSQTVSEIERIKNATGKNPLVDPEVFMSHWEALKESLEKDRYALESSMSPTAKKELKRRRKSGEPEVKEENPEDPLGLR